MKFLFVFLVLFFQSDLFCQERTISQYELNQDHVDKYIVQAKNEKNRDSIDYYYSKALLISQNINYTEGIIKSCKGLIQFHENDKEITNRLEYSLLLLNVYEKSGSKDQKIPAYNQLGKLYFNERFYSKAIEQYKKAILQEGEGKVGSFESQMGLLLSYKKEKDLDEALETASKLESKTDLSVLNKIDLQKEKAEIYHLLKAYNEELRTYELILTLIRNTESSYLEPIIWNNIGFTQKYLKNHSEAKNAFRLTIQKCPKKDYFIQGGAYYNLGLLLFNEQAYDSSLVCFKNAKIQYEALKAFDNLSECLNMESMVFYKKNDHYNAFLKVKEAIVIEKNFHFFKQLARSHEIKSLIHQDLFEYEVALDEYKQFLYIRDSLLTEDRLDENKFLYNQYKVEQVEKQFRLIWAKTELDLISVAKEKAEKEAEKERYNSKIKEDQLHISELKNSELKAKEELQRLQLSEEQLNRENTERKLALSKRENELKKLALEKEYLVISANKKEIEFLAQKSELDSQKRKNEAKDHAVKMRIVYGVFSLVAIVLSIILIAYRQLRKRKRFIEKQNLIIAESKALIEKEKEISESLLLNILPESIAEELKINGSSKPKLFDEVSVGFTDFSGFTMISEKLTAEQLVHKLDEIFYAFDLIIEKNGLQRIKTIGDAYMFAGGVPEAIENHSFQTVKAALDLRDYIIEYNSKLAEDEPKWNIRIGVNTGQIVAGVIGIKKFAYDIWGDAVNIAARMESSGEIGKVNVSGSTYELIKNQFETEYRGKVKAKNKGEIDMYFVENKS